MSKTEKKEMNDKESRHVLAILHGVFVGLAMTAVCLGPVKLMGPDAWGALWGVLAFGVFCGVCAYLVSNHLGKKEYK